MVRKHFNKSFFLLLVNIFLLALSINAQSITKVTGKGAQEDIEIKHKNNYFLLPMNYNIEIDFDRNIASFTFEPSISYIEIDSNTILITSSALPLDTAFTISSQSSIYNFFVTQPLSVIIKTPTEKRFLGEPVELEIGPFRSRPEEIVINSTMGYKPATVIEYAKSFITVRAVFDDQPARSKLSIQDENDVPTFLNRNSESTNYYFESLSRSTISFTKYPSQIQDFAKSRRIFLLLKSAGSETISSIMINDLIRLNAITPRDLTNQNARLICDNINRNLSDMYSIQIYTGVGAIPSPIGTIKQNTDQNNIISTDVKSDSPFLMVGRDTALLMLNIFDPVDIKFDIYPKSVTPGNSFTLKITGIHSYPSAVLPVIVTKDLEIEPLPVDNEGKTYKFIIPLTLPVGEYDIIWKSRYSEKKSNSVGKITIDEYSVMEDINIFIKPEIAGKPFNNLKNEPVDTDELKEITLNIYTDKITHNKGPQFIIVKITTTTKEGVSSDTTRKFSVFNTTDPRGEGPGSPYRTVCDKNKEYEVILRNQHIIGIKNREPWSKIKVEIYPDTALFKDDGTDISTNRIERNFKVKGPSVGLYLSAGIPKVLTYEQFGNKDDSRKDSLKYGSVSLLGKLFCLDEDGKRGWVSVGAGFYGLALENLTLADGGPLKLDEGGLILPQISFDVLRLLTDLKAFRDAVEVSLDFSLLIPFNYAYTRGLVSFSISFTPPRLLSFF